MRPLGIDPAKNGLAMVGDTLHVGVGGGGFVMIQLTANDMRKLALQLLLAADHAEGIESPLEAQFLADALEAKGSA